MTTLTVSRPTVKATVVIFNGCTARLQNPAFGQGLAIQRDRRLPIGPSMADRAWQASQNTTADASDEQHADFLALWTISESEYADLRADFVSALHDRYAHLDVEAAEMAEIGMSPTAKPEPASFATRLIEAIAVNEDDRSIEEVNADFEYDSRQAAIEAEAVRPKGPFLPDDDTDFDAPEAIDAITWAEQITTTFAEVATDDQLRFAREILAPDVIWQYADTTVMPFGPSLGELHDRLVLANRRTASPKIKAKKRATTRHQRAKLAKA